MKRMLFLALTVIVTLISFVTVLIGKNHASKDVAPDRDGHVLTQLWKEFNAAGRADKPEDQLAFLERIISEAQSRRLPKDFFDAWNARVRVASSRNWKLRLSLEHDRDLAFESFDEPVINVLSGHWNSDSLTASGSVPANRVKRLRGSVNECFYRPEYLDGQYADALAASLSDDYELALWHIIGRCSDNDFITLASLIEKQAGNNYPQRAFLDFAILRRNTFNLTDISERINAAESFSRKWPGTAAALLGDQLALALKKQSLDGAGSPTSGQYEALMAECRAFEKRRASYSGTDRLLCDRLLEVKSLMEELESRSMEALALSDSCVTVRLRNLDKVTVKIAPVDDRGRSDKAIFTSKVTNPAKSFYVMDSIDVPLPPIDDGKYAVELVSGKQNCVRIFPLYHISVTLCRDDTLWRIFAAEGDSGKPLKTCGLHLFCKEREVASAAEFSLGGLTALPEDISRKADELVADGGDCSLQCSVVDDSGRRLLSPPCLVRGGRSVGYGAFPNREIRPEALIFHDSPVYHRGDTVHCKIVVYSGTYRDEMSCAAGGLKAVLELEDARENVVDSRELTTNGYGSAAADFVIPSDAAPGNFSLTLHVGTRVAAYAGFSVADFVLPEFFCTFDKLRGLYYRGDTVEVTGRLKSYSGAPLSVTNARWKDNGTGLEHPLEIASDGTFSIKLATGEQTPFWRCGVTLIAASSTGETRQFSKRVFLADTSAPKISVGNALDAETDTGNTDGGNDKNPFVVADKAADIMVSLVNGDEVPFDADVLYVLKRDGKRICSSSAGTNSGFSVPLEECGDYTLELSVPLTDSSGADRSYRTSRRIIRIDTSSDVLCAPLESLFVPGEGPISFHFGSGRGPLWAVAALYGGDMHLLKTASVFISGREGEPGSLAHFELPYEESYPDNVRLKLFWFRKGMFFTRSHTYSRPEDDDNLSVEIERFTDTASPGTEYSVKLKSTLPAEALLAITDKSLETLRTNVWHPVGREIRPAVSPYLYSACMQDAAAGAMYANRSLAKGADLNSADFIVEEEALPFMRHSAANSSYPDSASAGDVVLRSDFATTLCWEPFVKLEPETKGNNASAARVLFRTSDKTGTFTISLFAHDRQMRNAVSRSEMVVSLPVLVSIVPPQILTVGDRYSLKVSLSATEAVRQPVAGVLTIDAGPAGVFSRQVSVEPGGTVAADFPLEPEESSLAACTPEGLPVKAVFAAEGGKYSDAVLIHIPIRSAKQTLTESHSAVVLAGQDRNAVEEALRSRFVNTSPYGAVCIRTDLMDMVKDELRARVNLPEGRSSSLDLMEYLCSDAIYTTLADTSDKCASAADTRLMFEKLLECRNGDGGFGWFAGMESSPLVTAVILERNAMIFKYVKQGIISADVLGGALRYLDASLFSKNWDYRGYRCWNLGVSMEQYLYVRSFYPSVPFIPGENVPLAGADLSNAAAKAELPAGKSAGKPADDVKEFSARICDYLCPKGARGLEGQLMAKTLRLATLRNLKSAGCSCELLKSLKVKGLTDKKMSKSYEADLSSIVQYAVEHPSGGMYYPNLVMPFRGLMASEAYCHCLLCSLMQESHPEISDAIRLWLMLQKETQKWDVNFEFLNALAAILEGSQALLQTEVTVMTKTYEKPCSEIQPAGNGFTVSRDFLLTTPDGGQRLIGTGDSLRVGDKLTARYRLWNAENRSFVKVVLPRFGCMMPCVQLSGWHREVLSDRTEYYFDVLPEENTTVVEEFFVTQAGLFTAPVVTVESLYAPHYRANGGYEGTVAVIHQ